MALSKSMLTGMSLTEEQVKAILEGHKESLDHYQSEADKAKAEAEEARKQLNKVQNDLNKLKEETDEGKNPYKVKYEAIKEEYDTYKQEVEAKAAKAAKVEAYKALLQECGVADKRIAAVVKVADIDSIELDDNGKIKDADTLKGTIKEEWGDFITTEETQGAKTSTPPSNTGGSKRSREEILAIKDTQARQQAMLENKELFL